MQRNVFTYGSLMFDPVWQSVVRGVYGHQPACLSGFRRHAIQGASYPAVVRCNTGSEVNGRLYLHVEAQDLQRLDRFEGAEYQRIACQVATQGSLVEAQVYLFLEPQRLQTHDWDERLFGEHGIAQFLRTYVPKSV